MSLSHTILASLFWCAVVFAFTGMNFMKYEEASHTLRESRIETALTDMHKALQVEMDKGEALPGLKTAEKILLNYTRSERDLLSAMIFSANTGKILFSTLVGQTGQSAPVSWRQKCVRSDTVFIEKEKDKETMGMPLLNAFSENTGCLVAQYTTESGEVVREKMIKTTFHYSVRLAAIGAGFCFFIYFFGFLVATTFQNKKIQLAIAFVLCQGLLLLALYFSFVSMFKAFDENIKQEMSTKTQQIAEQISARLGQAVQNGVPFDSITALETYLDQIRQKNKEILFILVTDKTGRVLYETGSAAEAFEADPYTGKISLREGYYNAAEPVNSANAAIGWVQIGVNERFVREKGF
ncbi:MAG: hypothetical protein J5787_04100 [Alphaproteobacteria bacterium]|nr:hypothetical protein [Alphaproteobacteria bacterium]